MPMAYYGNEEYGGVNGHFYHVFNTVSRGLVRFTLADLAILAVVLQTT